MGVRLLSTAWVFLLLLPGCSKAPTELEAVVLVDYRVIDGTPSATQPVTLDLARFKKEQIGRFVSRGIEFSPKAASTRWTLTSRTHVVYGQIGPEGLSDKAKSGPAVLVLKTELSLRPPGAETAMHQFWEKRFESNAKTGAAELKTVLTGLLAEGGAAQVDWMDVRLRLLIKNESDLIGVLKNPDPGHRLAAIERLAMLRSKRAVGPMLDALRVEKNLAVKQRMIGAFAEMGDERAARALINMADTRNLDSLRSILNTLSVIGGERVLEFFDLLSMHDAAAIRDMVSTARARLERSQKTSSKIEAN
ncbi:MAG: hypothetical protein CMH52_09205 [Myxococcales bacterium]|nr:hypothetical protein [Myxococcales bacterium]